MSYKEENEILERIREVEKTFNYQIASTTNPINGKINEITTKLDLLTAKIETLDTFFNEYKIKADKIDEFIQFKNKTLDQITSHELRINTMSNDITNMRIKYDKLFLDNLTVPGFIGEFCKFKTIRDYLDNNIKEMNALNSFRNDCLVELKSYNRKIENLVKQFTNSLDNFGDRQNTILSDVKIEIHDMVDKQIIALHDKFEEVKIYNTKEAKNLAEKSDDLIKVTKETIDYKEKLKNYFDDNMETINNDFDEIKLNIIDFNEEYSKIKDKFQEISDFVKDFNMKKYTNNKKDDLPFKRKAILRQKTVNFRSKQNDEFMMMNKRIDNNNDDLLSVIEKKNMKNTTEYEKKKSISLKKVPKINKEKEIKNEFEIEKEDKNEPKINIESKNTPKINIESKNQPENKIENKNEPEIKNKTSIKNKTEKIIKSKTEIEKQPEKINPNIKIEIEENIKPEIKKKTQQMIKKDNPIELENKKLEIKKENTSPFSKKLKINVLEKLNTEKAFSSSEEGDNDYSPIILPKYLNKKLNEQREIINNKEKIIQTPIKHFSDVTSNNISIKKKKDNAQNTIKSKEIIDEIEKKKYEKELSKKDFEELELKKHIINLRLKGKGDKSFGTTVMRDFNNNIYNKYMSHTNSYFYPHKKIDIMFKTNETWNSNKKNKDIIDCESKKGRKHNKVIPVSDMLTNKTEIINRKIEEICDLFKKNQC